MEIMKNITNKIQKQVVHSFSVKVGKTKPNNVIWEDTNLNQRSALGTQEQTRLHIVEFLGKKGIEKDMLPISKGTKEKKVEFFFGRCQEKGRILKLINHC